MKREGEYFKRVLADRLVVMQHVDKYSFFVGKLLVLFQFIVKFERIYRILFAIAFVVAVDLLKPIYMLLPLPGCPDKIYFL